MTAPAAQPFVPYRQMTAARVREIRARAAAGEKLMAIAYDLNLARSTVGRVVARKTWKQITP